MPMDLKKRPGWRKNIRPRILKRDGNKCRCCGLANHLWGYRDAGGKFHSLPDKRPAPPGFRAFRILLNVVHLDHLLENHDDENLGLMCQRCHGHYDKPITAAQAAYTNKYGRLPEPKLFNQSTDDLPLYPPPPAAVHAAL